MNLYQDNAPWRTRFAAAALVAPLVLAPLVATGAMFWARYESLLMHPAASARIPPTVSRAISDHHIGDVFSSWILLVCALQGFAVFRIALAFCRTAALSASSRHRARALALVGAAVLCEMTAIGGLIVLSHYDSHNYSAVHELGSFMLFFGNGIAIAIAGVFVRLEEFARRTRLGGPSEPPVPYDYYLQTRLAVIVSVIGVVFGVLFFDWDFFESINDYMFRVVFAMCELVLLIASLIYLASFVTSMYRYERNFLSRRVVERQAA